ncbi:hypothetical protein KXV78_000411 [Aspergillus fumigatus]|nr:hypothetical protein KXV78_000411 [Aspergillus fumigatus]
MSMLKVARIPVHGRSLSFLMDTCHENLQSYAEEIQDLVVRLENDIPELRPIRALVPVSNSYVEVAVTSEGENAVYERYGPPSYELFSDQDPAIDDCLLINPSWEVRLKRLVALDCLFWQYHSCKVLNLGNEDWLSTRIAEIRALEDSLREGLPADTVSKLDRIYSATVKPVCSIYRWLAGDLGARFFRYYESELQSIAHESSPLNVMLRELKEYSSVVRQGGSVALHRGETLMSPKLSKQVENLFTHEPNVDGPPKSWTDIVLWAGPVPSRVCSVAQLTVGDTQIELHKDDRELLCSGRPWAFLSPWPYPGDIEKELQVVEETLADVQKIKEMVNKVIGEASTLEQHLSTRRELLWDHRNDQMCITSKDTSISRTPEACSRYLHELRPPRESEIATYLNGGASNAGIQPSQFANPAPLKHDGSLFLPTEVVPMDLSDGHPGGSNTQNLHGSPMDHGSAPLDRANHSSPTMATEKASPGFASIANIITPTRNTESFTPINDERRLPVFIKRLVT